MENKKAITREQAFELYKQGVKLYRTDGYRVPASHEWASHADIRTLFNRALSGYKGVIYTD